MDRIIEVKVSGSHISKDNKLAGVRGEGNAKKLRITFDEGWGEYAKTVTFWDALGNNPVKRILTTDLLEDMTKSLNVYLVPVPPEAMTEAGTITFVIDGYKGEFQRTTAGDYVLVQDDEKIRQRSIADKLEVKYAPIADNAGEPADPTPSQAEQLQGQIDTLLGDIQAERRVVETATKAVGTALDLTDTNAKKTTADAELTGQYKEEAREHKEEARQHAESAANSSAKAHEALGKTNYIGDNGNWFAWDSEANAFYDTGVKAQAGSTVYLGENPPEGADVWVNPKGVRLDYVTREEMLEMTNKVAPSPASVTLYKDRWESNADGTMWYQEVVVANADITPYSKVDLQLSAEQIAIFYEKDLAFVAENDNKVITVYSIGRKPENDYVIQATVSEVKVDGA